MLRVRRWTSGTESYGLLHSILVKAQALRAWRTVGQYPSCAALHFTGGASYLHPSPAAATHRPSSEGMK